MRLQHHAGFLKRELLLAVIHGPAAGTLPSPVGCSRAQAAGAHRTQYASLVWAPLGAEKEGGRTASERGRDTTQPSHVGAHVHMKLWGSVLV